MFCNLSISPAYYAMLYKNIQFRCILSFGEIKHYPIIYCYKHNEMFAYGETEDCVTRGSISLTLRSAKFQMILSDLKVATGPEFVII